MKRALGVVLLAGLLATTSACKATGEPSGVPTGSESSPEATLPEIGESLPPQPTEPESTSLPGYDGWDIVNPKAVEIGETMTGFGMILTRQAQWLKADRGVLFHTTIEGDFRLTATVRTSRTSDSSVPPGGDGSTQLAGLMARLAGSSENWLFLGVGADGPSLAVDVLRTRDGQTSIEGRDWDSGDAELKICRSGSTFGLWYRPADTDEDWVEAQTVGRRDLGGSIQVGAAMSSDSRPDLTALFDDPLLEPLDAGEAC